MPPATEQKEVIGKVLLEGTNPHAHVGLATICSGEPNYLACLRIFLRALILWMELNLVDTHMSYFAVTLT